MADLNKINYDSNEIIKFDDMDFGESIKIANLNIILELLLKTSTGKDLILFGLNAQERSTPSMNVDLTIGLGFNLQDSTVLHTGSQLGPIAITNGESSERIDILEAKIVETDYDSQQRAFKDPSTGKVSIQLHDTKTRYTIQTQITKGTAGSGVAPNHTTGWIKLAEITVPVSESTAIYNTNIKNVDSGYESEANTGWTAETTNTIRINTLAYLKDIFRLKHSETGDHNNDVIQQQHIDWGLAGNQVSAEDVPVRDTASNFTSSDIEAVLAEIISSYASTALGKGASKIGVHDIAGNFTSTDVENALAEILSILASTASGKGASKIGVYDSAGKFTSTNVESVLSEILSILASTASGKGASKIGVYDSAGRYTASQVEAALAEIAGSGRASETVKQNATNVATHTAITDIHRKITISTSDPSGGSDGDVWMKY